MARFKAKKTKGKPPKRGFPWVMGYGFKVDLYQGDDIAVNFYRDLPAYDYKLIVFRAHSGAVGSNPQDVESMIGTYLFTNEPYSQIKYPKEQLNDELAKARVAESYPNFFAIGPKFITHSMRGNFNDAVVIVAGCSCLCDNDLAQAFTQKGASAYLAWDATVDLDYVDEATAAITDAQGDLVEVSDLTAYLPTGWNLLSTPIKLDADSDSLGQIFGADVANIDVFFGWDGVNWVGLTDYELSPLYAIYVKVKSGATATATFIPSSELLTPPHRDLQAGLNLIGPAPAFDPATGEFPAMPLDEALASIAEAPGGLTGYIYHGDQPWT